MAPNACAVEWMSIVGVEPADQSCGVTVFPPFSGIGTETTAHPFSNDMERSELISRGIGTTPHTTNEHRDGHGIGFAWRKPQSSEFVFRKQK